MRPHILLLTLAASLSACGRAQDHADHADAAAAGRSHVVNLTEAMTFEPVTLTVAAGDTVVWVGAGPTPHTVTDKPGAASRPEHTVLPAGAAAWDSGIMEQGHRYEQVLVTPGEYTYVCLLHEANGMVGRIVVQ